MGRLASAIGGQGVSIGLSMAAAAPLLVAHAARAQDLPEPIFAAQDALARPDVRDVFAGRDVSEQQALGIRAGRFVLRPSLDVSAIANTNIRAQADGGSVTAGVLAAPTIALASDTPRYALNAYVAGTVARYAERTTENVEQLFGGLSYSRPFGPTTRATAEVEGGRFVEDRAATFTPFDARTPIAFDRVQGRVTAVATPARWVINPGLEVLRLAYHDNRFRSDPSRVLVQRTRSLTRTNPSLLLGYAVSGDTAFYVGGEVNRRRYDLDTTRDSRGYVAYVGGRIRPTPLVRVDAAIGYLRQNYRGAFADPKALYLRTSIDWVPTPLTTLRFDLRRDVSEAGAIQRSGALRTRTRLRLSHELYRDLTVTLGAQSLASRFADTDRTDRRSFLTGEARYFANRRLELFAAAEQLFSRSGDLPTLAPDFDRTIVRAGVRLKR